MEDLDLKESIDFNFFDDNVKVLKEDPTTPSSQKASAKKPPVHPNIIKPLPKAGTANDKISHPRKSWSSSESDISRDSSPENLNAPSSKSENVDKSKTENHTKTYKTTRSPSSSLSSSSSSRSSRSTTPEKTNSYYNNHFNSKDSDTETKTHITHSSSDSDDNGRPRNPIAKTKKQTLHKKYEQEKAKYADRKYSESSLRNNKKSSIICNDNGDSNQPPKSRQRRHVWEDVDDKEHKNRPKSAKASGMFSRERPKSASNKKNFADQLPQSRTLSSTFSDSDITDVSSIDTPRKNSDVKASNKSKDFKMSSSGDGHPVKIRLKSVSDISQQNENADNQDHDPDKISGLDLKILMKAVGELGRQKIVQANPRHVMFNPATLRNIDKSNYTFDKKQERDIERENHRLLKEIVRHVNSEDQSKHFHRQPNYYRLTPSAINRERDIQRIERENLAFLKRLQAVKPTKAICRDQQLKDYESTVFRGVPIAALHPRPNRRNVHNCTIDDSDISIDGRTRSVTSVSSVGSSIRSGRSCRSSRPSSASRKLGFPTNHIDSRPAWSDRW